MNMCVTRDGVVLFIGTETECNKVFSILEEYHRYENVVLEIQIPEEQEYILDCLNKPNFKYGY